MSTFLFANNATTTLASSLSPSDTLVQVATGTGAEFPSPGPGEQFSLTLQDAATGLIEEITYVTAVSGDDLTVIRGQEGTTALSWGVGDLASNYWTAGQAAALVQIGVVQKQATNYAVDTGSADAAAAALDPAITAYSQIIGSPIRIKKVASANTGVATLNLNAIAPIAIRNPDGSNLLAGQLGSGAIFEVIYNGTYFQLVSIPAVGQPTGALGGDLAGSTLPNPVVAANKITAPKMQQVAALSLLANILGVTGNMSVVAIVDLLGAVGIDTTNAAFPTGYMDVLGIRLQWSVVTNNDDTYNSHALPAPFEDANFVAWTGIKFNNSPPKTGGNGGGATWYPIDASHIGILTAWNGDSTGINQISYLAIGLTPV